MIKEYKDSRINALIKESFEKAIKDSEWNIRYLSEWNLLFDCIDKMLEFVESGKTREIYINRNMWYILQDTMFNIFDLYGVDIVQEDKITEKELLIEKKEEKKMNDTNNELIKLGLKRLYIVDNTPHIFNFNELRGELINNIKRDTIENGNEDSDIIKSNLELLEKIYSDNYKYNEDFIIEELKAFGYVITKVDSITSNLLDLKYFMENNNRKNIVDKIDILLKEICNYFNNEVNK